MKKILTILLAGVSTLAIAQKRVNLSRSIDDDGKTLSIKASGTVDGKSVAYDRSFNVEDMSKEEREELREKVLASIAAGDFNLPEPPRKNDMKALPTPPKPAAAPAAEPMVFSSNEVNAEIVSSGKGYIKEPVSNDPKGYSKQVRYNPDSGEMFLKYRFVKNDEEFIYEKTVNAAEKSEKERLRIIEAFENEIALPGKGMEM
jgi:hypothetical protein